MTETRGAGAGAGAWASVPSSGCGASTQPRVSYAYDAVGNPTGLTEVGATGATVRSEVSTFDAADQLTSTVTTVGVGAPSTKSFVYNANGELTSGGRTYDALGRLTGKANPAGSGAITYGYDALGRRVSMVRTGADAGSQSLVWDVNAALPVVALTDNSGDVAGAGTGQRAHVWSPQGVVLGSFADAGESWWYTHDALGSVTDVTSGGGVALTSARYGLFGEQVLTDNRTSPVGDVVWSGFGFTGGLSHLGDGEVHLRARDYDPMVRGFSAPDPIGPDLGAAAFTTYRYGNNSPLVFVDPSGEWGISLGDAWGAVKKAGSVVASTSRDVAVGVWDSTTNHVSGCAARDGSSCLGLFVDVATLGTVEAVAADVSGCASRDVSSCGWLWVDTVTLGVGGVVAGSVARAGGGGVAGAVTSKCRGLQQASKSAPSRASRRVKSRVADQRGSVGFPGGPRRLSPDDGLAANAVPPRFITTGAGVTIDRASVAARVAQTQGRHVAGHANYGGRGYFNSLDDAQSVLDDFHSGAAQVLGVKRNGDIVVRSPNVTGFNHNPGAGFPNQPTNVFFIKGTSSPSVVPYNPAWTP